MAARRLVAVGFNSCVLLKMCWKFVRMLSAMLFRKRKMRPRLIDSAGRCGICRLSSAFLSRLEAFPPGATGRDAAYNLEKFM
jgi:hypothetical protein